MQSLAIVLGGALAAAGLVWCWHGRGSQLHGRRQGLGTAEHGASIAGEPLPGSGGCERALVPAGEAVGHRAGAAPRLLQLGRSRRSVSVEGFGAGFAGRAKREPVTSPPAPPAAPPAAPTAFMDPSHRQLNRNRELQV